MIAKEAVKKAKDELLKLVEDENPSNIGLEEIEWVPEKEIWKVTIGFSRPWNTVKNAFTAISGEPATRRAYRMLELRDSDGAMLSMKRVSFTSIDADA